MKLLEVVQVTKWILLQEQTVVQKAKDKVKSAAGKSKNFLSKLKLPQGKNLESRIIKGGKNLYNLITKRRIA